MSTFHEAVTFPRLAWLQHCFHSSIIPLSILALSTLSYPTFGLTDVFVW